MSDNNVETVVFVVHGMGQLNDKYARNVAVLDQNVGAILNDTAMVHFIPVHWHAELHKLPSIDARIRQVTLQTVPLLRTICNDYLGDLFYYLGKYHGAEIRKIVASAINDGYRRLMRERPNFCGKIVMLGHSLGGILLYDMLCRQSNVRQQNADGLSMMTELSAAEFDFVPTDLVMLGAPLSALMIQRKQEWSTYRVHTSIKLHNVFHPLDPLAYRYEPLIDGKFMSVEPVAIEHWNGNQVSMYQDYVSPIVEATGSMLYSAGESVTRRLSSAMGYFTSLSSKPSAADVQE